MSAREKRGLRDDSRHYILAARCWLSLQALEMNGAGFHGLLQTVENESGPTFGRDPTRRRLAFWRRREEPVCGKSDQEDDATVEWVTGQMMYWAISRGEQANKVRDNPHQGNTSPD